MSALVTTGVLACGLAACGDAGASGGGAASDAWSPTSDVSTAPGSDGLTPPGAVLEPGDTATVMWADSILSDANTFPAEVTVDADAISEGDRTALEADPAADGMGSLDDMHGDAWYIRATVRLDDSQPGHFVSIRAIDADGEMMDSASGGYADCRRGEAPTEPSKFETCSIAFGDSPPVAVAWDQGSDAYDDDPVVWYLGS